jgi:hypothetical protein
VIGDPAQVDRLLEIYWEPDSMVPTSPKRPSKLRAAPRAKRVAKASSPSTKPSLRFYHSENLRAKTLEVLTTLEKAKDGKQHRNELADIVVELSDSGLDYYFMRPLKLAEVGFLVEQSANFGMSAAKGVFASVIRNIIGRMDNPQLLSICSYIRQLMK